MNKKVPFLQAFSKIPMGEMEQYVADWSVIQANISKEERKASFSISYVPRNDFPTNGVAIVENAIAKGYQLTEVRFDFVYQEAPLAEEIPPELFAPPEVEMVPQVSVFEQTAKMREEAMVLERQTRKKKTVSPIIYGSAIKNAPIPISDLNLDSGMVVVEGDVFFTKHDEKKKRNAWVIAFDVTDHIDSVRVQKFMPSSECQGIVNRVKQGIRVRVQGRLSIDRFYNDIILEPVAITQVDKEMRQDNAKEKRVELHMHSNMSALDALTSLSPKDSAQKNVVKRADSWGHAAIAITDHGVAHIFPDAEKSAKGLDIKMIYGVEAYFNNNVDDSIVVQGEMSGDFAQEIVCFDIETTGLNNRKELLTEIGAVILKNGEFTETFQTFVQPNKRLSPEIIQLTGITDKMLENAPSQEEALKAFLAFVGDRPLAAHNASFDMGFIGIGCEKYGIPFENPVIDTLTMSQNLLTSLKKFKLDIVADHLNLPNFNHHRAVDDATVVGHMLVKFWDMLKEKDVTQLEDINEKMRELRPNSPSIVNRRRFGHLIVLAKNKVGLRNMYKLISFSHLDYFKGKAVMPKSVIEAHREGLILGSACEAGELYQAILYGKPKSELIRIASWYDYLEIQPICNNLFLISNGTVENETQLQDINREIVALGKELGKPVCATGDVHFLDPEDEVFRRVLLASKKFANADAPLPLYFKTTEEMLEEFSYLGEEDCYDVVIKNTNLVADWCEEIQLFPKGLFPPSLENSQQELTDLVWGKVHSLYGETPPAIVQDRVSIELNDIITSKYDVIYMSAQKLVHDSMEHGYLVGSRGSVGSSIVAYMSGITEVNSLPAHYRCPNCKHSDFETPKEQGCGCGVDMPDALCPQCGTAYEKDGFNIPFETFLGFSGDKVPDIDLNFSGEYQANSHKYTFELFGKEHVFKAGTVGTVAETSAYGLARKYFEERGRNPSKAEINRLTVGCAGVKRTTGQHPGGMVVIPQDMEIYDFCPVQRPADKEEADFVTTHFEYHAMEDNLLKLDILGHRDPTMMYKMQQLSGVDVQKIPLDDKDAMSIFHSTDILGFTGDKILGSTGTVAIPEFGTPFTRDVLVDTAPDKMDILVRISGFTHGTDVWTGNAEDLVKKGTASVLEAIGCRDDIMLYLISLGMDEKYAFKIMEAVRKGKGLPEGAQEEMEKISVPAWYIESCQKIKYLFPKAHAVAYVIMAFRVAWFKVHMPLVFYASYFSVRAKAFDESYMCRGMDICKRKIEEIKEKEKDFSASPTEKDMLTSLLVCYEFYLRGFSFEAMDLYRSAATDFTIDQENQSLIPPFTSVAGLGDAAAETLVEQREKEEFISIEDVAVACPKVSKTHIDKLSKAGAFGTMPESSQLSFF
ncbi:MAG: PolC-type DNA polymerase III [Eubacteriales bacterium]